MILYNVTAILDDEIQKDWFTWMKDQHIPEVMDTGCFISYRMLQVLDSPNEGVTYCIQYVAETIEDYDRYLLNYAPSLRATFPEKFTNKFVIYRSLMQFVG